MFGKFHDFLLLQYVHQMFATNSNCLIPGTTTPHKYPIVGTITIGYGCNWGPIKHTSKKLCNNQTNLSAILSSNKEPPNKMDCTWWFIPIHGAKDIVIISLVSDVE